MLHRAALLHTAERHAHCTTDLDHVLRVVSMCGHTAAVNSFLDNPAHRALARTAAQQSMVLLVNGGGHGTPVASGHPHAGLRECAGCGVRRLGSAGSARTKFGPFRSSAKLAALVMPGCSRADCT